MCIAAVAAAGAISWAALFPPYPYLPRPWPYQRDAVSLIDELCRHQIVAYFVIIWEVHPRAPAKWA